MIARHTHTNPPYQPPLLDALPPVVEPVYERGQTLAERFAAFHATNPHVLTALRELALRLRRRGVKHYGIAALFEVLRFESMIRTADPEGWKLNNSYRSFYSRLLMAQCAELDGFFETRTSAADEVLQ